MELSIIVPVFNVEKYIIRTLSSLVQQVNKDFEIIIVDDGSTDRTYHLASKFLIDSGFNKFKIIQQDNMGVSVARNKGLYEASGKYIIFFDGDDLMSNELTVSILDSIEFFQSEMLFWGFDINYENTNKSLRYFDRYKSDHNTMNGVEAFKNIIINKNMWIWTGSVVYRKDFLLENKIYYTPGCIAGEDLEFIYKSLLNAKSVTFIPKVLSYYMVRSNSTPNRYNIQRFTVIEAMKRLYKYIEALKIKDNQEILEIVSSDLIIEGFLGIYNLCLMNLNVDGYPINKAVKKIFIDIDNTFPNMLSEVNTLMQRYNGKNIALSSKISIFQFSPIIYYLSSRFLKNIKRG